jgi:hypothetical protein
VLKQLTFNASFGGGEKIFSLCPLPDASPSYSLLRFMPSLLTAFFIFRMLNALLWGEYSSFYLLSLFVEF